MAAAIICVGSVSKLENNGNMRLISHAGWMGNSSLLKSLFMHSPFYFNDARKMSSRVNASVVNASGE